MQRLIQTETQSGQPVQAGGYTITPFARSLRINVRRFPAGLIWNRPVSVHVRTPSGQEYILPVVDVTRQAQFTLLGVSLGSVIIFGLIKSLLRR